MSDRYYRRNNNEIKNFNKLDQTVNELKNVILSKINGIQQKIEFLNSDLDIVKNDIHLENILKFELKENIYIYFDKESDNTFRIVNISLTNLKKGDIIETNFNMLNKIKFYANNQVILYINYKFINDKNIIVCGFDIDENIYRNKIVNNYVLSNIDKDYESIDSKINFYMDNTKLNDYGFVEIFHYKETYGELIIEDYNTYQYMNYYRDKNINDIDKYIINTINNINVELESLDERISSLENGNNNNKRKQ